ncbi:MAG: DUF11 domain-containing protein [Chloroflexota bacterium]|nr:DUF11 domain-containing protein [Chloroflexota bacterium]
MHARTTRRSGAGWRSAVAAAGLFAAILLGPGLESSAGVEVPPAGGGFYIQTSGPNAGAGIGDWYSSSTVGAGNGYNYLVITVPCGWPPATPLYVDLFSPEMNAAGALISRDEPRGAVSDSTQFELYGPGASVGPGYDQPLPGAALSLVATTYLPEPALPEAWVRLATLPATCGVYALRSAVLGEGDDDNGWRVRVGTDTDVDPNNLPPANSDDADGLPGTNDEIIIGQEQITYQHSSGGVACLTLFEYVSLGLPSVTFHNYDMDGNTRVTYYAPSDAFDPTGLTDGTAGTLSINAGWNGGVGLARGGDTIANPEAGWWRIVTCLSSVNQFIQEAQDGIGAYFSQPPTPALSIAKTDGVTVAPAGGDLTYVVTVTNTSSGATAGAALAVVVTDTIPTNTTFVGCAITAPATGTCGESAGVVTANLDDWIDAGASADVEITVTVDLAATGTVTNGVTAVYEDALGNPFPEVSASDIDTVGPPLPTATPTPTPIPSVPNAGMGAARDEQGPIIVTGALVAILVMGLLGLASLAERRQRRTSRRRVR